MNIIPEFSRQEIFGIFEAIMLFILLALSNYPFSNNNAMAKIEINLERCKGCGLCTISCPKKLIRLGEEINRQGYFYALWEGQETCTGCALCGEICPDIAITIWK